MCILYPDLLLRFSQDDTPIPLNWVRFVLPFSLYPGGKIRWECKDTRKRNFKHFKRRNLIVIPYLCLLSSRATASIRFEWSLATSWSLSYKFWSISASLIFAAAQILFIIVIQVDPRRATRFAWFTPPSFPSCLCRIHTAHDIRRKMIRPCLLETKMSLARNSRKRVLLLDIVLQYRWNDITILASIKLFKNLLKMCNVT